MAEAHGEGDAASPSKRPTPALMGLNLDGLQASRSQQGLTVECTSSRSPRIAGLSLELGSSPRGPNVMEDSWKGEIVPGFLYLSDRMTAGDADRLNSLGVTHVVNVSTDIPNFFEGKDVGGQHRRITYKRCALKDRIDADVGAHFDAACAFIEDARVNNGRVLVHCRAGMSRSATIVIGYIMITKRWDLKRSLHYVDSCRFVQPNSGFMDFLINLEKSHFDGRSTVSQADLYPGPTSAGQMAAPTGC
mmetsp:Transcript_4020/g.13490  ORF Transcript_4020/g.13490 Transcript_4020/m.13490 type:complete len:247 (-) Transcript_4020:106-846(-)